MTRYECVDGVEIILEGSSSLRQSVLFERANGLGPVPQIELYFRLAESPDLGIFKFQTGSWSLAYDLAAEGIEDKLAELGKVNATLTLEEVSFVAKNGAMAGKTVRYTKPVVHLLA